MIELSSNERTAVYASLVSGYHPDRRRYSTTYRGDDSRDALSIDVEHGWFDHSLDKGGDAIAFVQECANSSFREACSIVSEIIGRDILGESDRAHRPRYTEADLVRAELFVIGFRWYLERLLQRLKEPLNPDPRISEATRLLEHLKAWTANQAADYAATLKHSAPKLVAECIAEAREVHLQLASVIGGARPGGFAA
jgi:hypothetical protein